MTRRRGVAAEEDAALRDARRRASRRSAPWSARPGALHLEKVTKVSREENLAMIADSVGFLRGRGQAGRLRRRALLRRLARRLRLRARVPARRGRRPAPRTSPSATPTAPACRRRSPRRPPRWSTRWASGSRSASTPTTTPSAAVANSLAAVDAGARLVQGTINGYGERCGNANLVSILPALQLKMGYECVPRRAAAAAHRDRPLRRRALQPARPTPTSPTSAATPSPTRAGCTSPACRPTPAPSSTSTRRWSATAATS